MTGHATRFDPANRATEHTPVGCGEESPRSYTRWKKQRRRERGRPRPHQRDDRPYDPFGSRKCRARTFTDWGCPNNVSVPIWPHSIASLTPMVSHPLPWMQWALVGAKRLECGSLLPLCLMPKQRVCPHIPYSPSARSPVMRRSSIPQIGPPNIHRLGCGEESPRSRRRVRRNTDARERGRPRPHQRDDRPYDPLESRKYGARTFTGRNAQTECLSPYGPIRSPR